MRNLLGAVLTSPTLRKYQGVTVPTPTLYSCEDEDQSGERAHIADDDG